MDRNAISAADIGQRHAGAAISRVIVRHYLMAAHDDLRHEIARRIASLRSGVVPPPSDVRIQDRVDLLKRIVADLDALDDDALCRMHPLAWRPPA